MNFASALFSLGQGYSIKRHHWTGYWCLGKEDSPKPYVEMHTSDGKVLDLRDTGDTLATLSNCACDDWEIVDWSNVSKELNNEK